MTGRVANTSNLDLASHAGNPFSAKRRSESRPSRKRLKLNDLEFRVRYPGNLRGSHAHGSLRSIKGSLSSISVAMAKKSARNPSRSAEAIRFTPSTMKISNTRLTLAECGPKYLEVRPRLGFKRLTPYGICMIRIKGSECGASVKLGKCVKPVR